MKFYSQHGEDCLLWQFFEQKSRGYYVDVGAFDGVHLSNTYTFELAGWSGLCVEPLPDMFARCQQHRPGAACVNMACIADATQTQVTFYVEALGLLSGVQPDREADVQRRYERRGLHFEGFQTISVQACTLTSLLDAYVPNGTSIDFISIDVEGTELDVLRGLDFTRYRPRLFILEANTSAQREALLAFMQDVGYVPVRRLGVNIIFAQATQAQDIQALRTITIDCEVELMKHPADLTHTPDSLAQRRHIYNKGIAEAPSAPLYRLKHTIKRLLRIKPS